VAGFVAGILAFGQKTEAKPLSFNGVPLKYDEELPEMDYIRIDYGEGKRINDEGWCNSETTFPVWGQCKCIGKDGFHHWCFNIKRVDGDTVIFVGQENTP
jgi:hypothetical protein